MNGVLLDAEQTASVRLRHLGGSGTIPVLCFPSAGGASTQYSAFAVELAKACPAVRVVGVDPPGHGASRTEFAPTFSALVTDYAETIRTFFPSGVILLGHSFGGLVAYALATVCESLTLGLCLMAALPPNRSSSMLTVDLHSEGEVVALLEQLEGVPRPVLNSKDLMHRYIPALVSDLALMRTSSEAWAWETYHEEALILGGCSDPVVDVATNRRWQSYCPAASWSFWPGAHFFYRDSGFHVSKRIAEYIERRQPRAGTAV